MLHRAMHESPGAGPAAAGRRGRRKPNLFLIGAMKSGTTYLRKLLAAHPAIFMSDPDEPSYFVDPRQLEAIWPDMWRRGLWRDEERYLRLFDAAGEATLLGEASTNYTKRPRVTGVAERIAAFNPDARCIYLMRDPVERTISHYWHMVRHHAEHRPALAAIRQDSQFLEVSHYAMQFRPFLECFGRDRVAALTHERLVRDPAAVMRELYDWLGVDPDAVDPSGLALPENVTPAVVSLPLWRGIPRRVRRSWAVEGIMPLVPRPVRTALHRLTNREVHRRAVDLGEVIGFLQPIQRRQTEELGALLGRAFPEWTTLHADRPARTEPAA